MGRDSSSGSGTAARAVGIGSAVAVMVAVVLALGPLVTGTGGTDEVRADPAMQGPSGDPIPAEAGVFRGAPVAASYDSARRTGAHRRTLATYRSLRAFPGAPPRIPHGLTAEEFRSARCGACHERGGYVARFNAYAPTTPHPELAECLQCHPPDDRVVGVPLPTGGGDQVCLQCHEPGVPAPQLTGLDWRAAAWPETNQRALPDAPPSIPHDLHMRGNCLGCHMGRGAVEEIRTGHPERPDCRQCHLPLSAEDAVFRRPPSDAAGGGGS